ncbi:MAG: GDSL-type esterase/lipase family protein [Lentisphaeria bacterium]|jgi:lysophospholipase L1-like esterase|nr:GDSL-type esterase/lipase family protein [Lentisphaeria bacterium]
MAEKLSLVVLLGDSIRMGYQKVVARELAGVAEVWFPEENGCHTKHTLARLPVWFADREPTMVHLNIGLHDMWVNEDGSNRHALPEYLADLRQVIGWLQCHISSRLVFALTTPVDQDRQCASAYGRVVRRNGDIPRYNAATRSLMESLGIGVNDLYTVVEEAGTDRLIADDGVHFRPEGYEILGQAVAARIRQELAG